jgi:transcriptional regulator with XRE-family HTH domain
MRTHEAFGPLLRRLRTEAGKKLDEIAKPMGVSITYLSEVERGTRAPLTLDRVKQAAAILDVDPVVLQKAAGVSRGSFTLTAGPTSRHVDVGAELAAMWPELSQSDLFSIAMHCEAARARRRKARETG